MQLPSSKTWATWAGKSGEPGQTVARRKTHFGHTKFDVEVVHHEPGLLGDRVTRMATTREAVLFSSFFCQVLAQFRQVTGSDRKCPKSISIPPRATRASMNVLCRPAFPGLEW
jgi:hypothetical protein